MVEQVVVDAVAEALKSKKLAGAAFDVFPKEPASSQEKFVTSLQGCPNTILTPHIGSELGFVFVSGGVLNSILDFRWFNRRGPKSHR